MDSLTYLEKPLDFDILTKSIQNALELGSRSYIRGITLSTFVQLIYMERKTCTLKVQHNAEIGYVYIRNGHIIEAELADKKGLEAAYVIIAWDETGIEMDNHCRINVGSIVNPVEQVLLEALKIKDERSAMEIRPYQPESKVSKSAPRESSRAFIAAEEDFVLASTSPQGSTSGDTRRERIDQFCRQSSGILEYIVLDDHNFPEFKSKEPATLDEIDPSKFLELADEMSDQVAGGCLDHILFSTKSLVRYLIFRLLDCRVVLSLKPGVRPAQVMKDLRKATNT